ncbi:MAG: cation:proton antiporter [Verrucomicrobiae bacterium]|nr:cation:proton antiporter [Verrucomicrobiae bacterium]
MTFLANADSEAMLSLTLLISAIVGVALLFHRLKQSMIIAYLLAGILVGQSGLGWVRSSSVITSMAEIGVIVLMFTLGIEFSVSQLKRLRRAAFVGGGFYVAVLVAMTVGVCRGLGVPVAYGIFFGVVIAVSSTAIAIKLLEEGGQLNTAQSQLTIGISIFQDLLVVPFMIVFPVFMVGAGESTVLTLWGAFLKAFLFLGCAWLAARYVIPIVLEYVVQTRSRELFTIMVIGLCLGIAMAAYALGLSLALGAFVAGLVVSETMYSHKILSDVLPFKDFFLSIFFVSIGMLLDVSFLKDHLFWIILLSLLIVPVKFVVGNLAGMLGGYQARPTVISALSLATVGEFSFVLLQWGRSTPSIGLSDHSFQMFIAVTIFSMGIVPLLFNRVQPLAQWISGLGVVRRLNLKPQSFSAGLKELQNHVVVCGAGPVGARIIDHLTDTRRPLAVVEMNPDTVKKLRAEGVFALYADAAHPETHHLVHTSKARALVITIPDFSVAASAVTVARKINPQIFIMARAKFSTHAEELKKMGVDVVIHDEKEVSLEMMRQILVFQGDDPLDALADIKQMRLANS